MTHDNERDSLIDIVRGYRPRKPDNGQQRGYQPEASGSNDSLPDLTRRPPSGGSSIQEPRVDQTRESES